MSFLRGRTVRIIVSEPWNWDRGNLFGTIIYDRDGGKIRVRLDSSIKGNKFTSDLLELTPRYEKETFKSLIQLYSVTVAGVLLKEETDESDHLLIGSVTFD